MDARPRPIDLVLDLAVYAPIGCALAVREQVPALAIRGREQAEQRIRLARMIGQFAVAQGRRELTRRLDAMAAQRAASTDPVVIEAVAHELVDDGAGAPSDTSSLEPTVLAIPEYDSLAASQVVARLGALSPSELDAVEQHERSHRGRRTVLGRIHQLRQV